jgi:hypothetical protein
MLTLPASSRHYPILTNLLAFLHMNIPDSEQDKMKALEILNSLDRHHGRHILTLVGKGMAIYLLCAPTHFAERSL